MDLDGSLGEGGGQILRTALSLSLVTGTPFRMRKIRAGRKRPGLQAQHLAAVRAAAEIGKAALRGDRIGSQELAFEPRRPAPGNYVFSIGTAGSASLVLQTVLPALAGLEGPSSVIVEGGTHNDLAPPFPHLARAFLPLLNRLGAAVTATLHQAGFFPVGGGKIQVDVGAPTAWQPLHLPPAEGKPRVTATAVLSKLPQHIAKRELDVLAQRLHLAAEDCSVEHACALGPGNVCYVTVERDGVTDVFTGFGRRGVPAEDVARSAAAEAEEFLNSRATVGPHLADQLLLPLALAGEGSFYTLRPTLHLTTNAAIIAKFLKIEVETESVDDATWQVRLAQRS